MAKAKKKLARAPGPKYREKINPGNFAGKTSISARPLPIRGTSMRLSAEAAYSHNPTAADLAAARRASERSATRRRGGRGHVAVSAKKKPRVTQRKDGSTSYDFGRQVPQDGPLSRMSHTARAEYEARLRAGKPRLKMYKGDPFR